MKYSIRLDFDTDEGRKQLLSEGISETTDYTGEVFPVEELTDESHIEGMKEEIICCFGVPGDTGVAGFTGYEIVKEKISADS
jgi:hypothetical protein